MAGHGHDCPRVDSVTVATTVATKANGNGGLQDDRRVLDEDRVGQLGGSRYVGAGPLQPVKRALKIGALKRTRLDDALCANPNFPLDRPSEPGSLSRVANSGGTRLRPFDSPHACTPRPESRFVLPLGGSACRAEILGVVQTSPSRSHSRCCVLWL